MKKYLFYIIIAPLIALTGCQNEEMENESTDNGGKKVVLTANIQGAADSRVALTPATDESGNPIVKVAWREYDEQNPEEFTVYDYREYKPKQTFRQVSDNVFKGNLPDPSVGTPFNYCAYYNPDVWLNMRDTGYFTQDGTLREENFFMYTEFNEDDTSINFEHMMAILKPTFTSEGQSINSTITSIEMSEIQIGEMDVTVTVAPTSPATTLAENIYLTIPIIYDNACSFRPNNTFTFAVKASGNDYIGSLTIPDIANWEPEGKLFTATIELKGDACNLPEGTIFRTEIANVIGTATAIKFVAGSNDGEAFPADNKMPANMKYQIVENTLELHTPASEFVFHESCTMMFSSFNSGPNIFETLTSIDFNCCVNTSKVKKMSRMFANCFKLTSLDLSSFNTSNVDNMLQMFNNCNELTSLDLSSFNTSNLTNMSYMFSSCYGLSSLDIHNFKLDKVEYITNIFNYVGKNYYNDNNNTKTRIIVTSALASALNNKGANVGAYAMYDVIREAVDLGLSVKWASFNIGAQSPEDYGDYFPWGETKKWSGRAEVSSKTKAYGLTLDELKRDGIIDNNKNLTATYDAATANWGDGWRMPTLTEIKELMNNSKCKWTFTTMNGVKGFKIESLLNGNSIFLPNAGFHNGWEVSGAGVYGDYWSTTAYSANGSNYSYYLATQPNNGVKQYLQSRRDLACTIRPVKD